MGRVPPLLRLGRAAHSESAAQRVLAFAVGLLFIGGVIAVDELVFRTLFDSSYLRWYLENGALIGIAFGVVTIAWGDLNKLTRLISAHPLEYAATCLALGSLPSLGLAALIRPDPSARLVRRQEDTTRALHDKLEALEASGAALPEELREKLDRNRQETGELVARADAKERPPKGIIGLDVLLAMLFALAFLVVYAAWALVVAPLQYVVNLAAGAPARTALASPNRAWSLITGREILVREAPKSDDLPEGAVESGFSARPVTFTVAVASALLFTVSFFTG